MDGCFGRHYSMEHVVQGEASSVHPEDDDNFPNFEDSSYSRNNCEFRTMQGLGDLGDGEQISDHGSDLF